VADLEPVGVVGAGTMGAGIAQLALEAGHRVALFDVAADAFGRARERVSDGLARRAARLALDPDSIDAWVDGRLSRLHPAATLEDLGATGGLIVEAALEDLSAKRGIFRVLDSAAPPEAILATNTSALSVGEIAAATDHPERVLGLHFFNPAPIMPLVEVVVAPGTSPATADRAMALMTAWGKTPIRCTDTPGFIVNRVNRPFTIAALRLVEAGEAGVEAIDAAMRAAGYPMGPFELIDLIGVDVNLAVAKAIWEGLGRPERLRPSPLQVELVEAGRLGRKTGQGFYRYEGGRPIAVEGASQAQSGGTTLEPSAIQDRVEAAVSLEAHLAADDGVASKVDIDRAMRLGAGHPRGPFEREAGR
jgi:3-hydroxybutyryl-CoA dehydrogenase